MTNLMYLAIACCTATLCAATYLYLWNKKGRERIDVEDAALLAAIIMLLSSVWPVGLPFMILWAIMYALTRKEENPYA